MGNHFFSGYNTARPQGGSGW